MVLNRLNLSEKLSRRSFYAVTVSVIGALLLFFYTEYVVLSLLFLITVAVAWTVNILEINWMGIETATFATIVIGAASNTVTGGIAGLVFIMAQMAARQQFGTYILWVIPSYAAAGALTGYLQPADIVGYGIGITIALHALFMVLTGFRTPAALSNYVPYAVINIGLNILLFRFMAAPVLGTL